MNSREKERAAYYQAGHIVVTYLYAPNKQISRTTLISPESRSGLTWITDKEKVYSRDKFLLLTELKVLLAGYVAEKAKFGTTSNNVGKEFEQAMDIVHNMAWRWGMGRSGYVGDFDHRSSDDHFRWRHGAIPTELDRDAQDMLDDTLNELRNSLRKKWELVEFIAKKMIEKNELNESEIMALFAEKGVKRPSLEDLLQETEKKEEKTLGWDDIVGMEEVKAEAKEVVKLIKDRATLKKVGGKIMKGLIMLGPPGCGKTYLATAMANEAGVPFIAKAGSEFVEMYVGVGASRIRRLFMEAKELAQEKGGCIIFIDEIDALGAKRETGASGAGREHNQTLNQLLVEMDGLKDKDSELNIIVIGATNMDTSYLDSALLRPGRFDRHITMALPNLEEREAIFQFYLNKINYDKDDIKVDRLARLAVVCSPAEIANMVREAALIAVRNGKDVVGMKDINEARERIDLGLKRKCRYSEKEKELVAYHEAGHAVVTYLAVPFQDVFKVSIIPRGSSGGITWVPENVEINIKDRSHLMAYIKVAVASYVSEKIKFGITSTGISGDFNTATNIAYDMAWRMGMGKHGHVGDYRCEAFKGRLPAFSAQLDEDSEEILKECVQESEDLLRRNWNIVEEMVQRLMSALEIDFDEIEEIFKKYGKQRSC
jgi:cell division protease FtsH